MIRNRKSRAALLLALPALLCGVLLVGGSPTQAEVTNPGAVSIKVVGGNFTMNKADPDGDPPINFAFPNMLGPWACNDGIDNDSDGFTDLGSDPECAAPTGTYPAGQPAPTQADTNEAMAGYQGVYECNDGIDQDLDGLIDHSSVNAVNPDSGGTNGCSYSTDADEDSFGNLNYVAPTFTGTTAADGTVSVTSATFQANYISFDASALGVGIIKAQVTMLPEGFPWTGNMNPNYGSGAVSMDSVRLTIKIVITGLGSCRMGATDGSQPMVIDNLTTGTSGGLTGVPAAPGTGVATVVRGDFGLNVSAHDETLPDSCPVLLEDGMNDFLNLPNASGNDARFTLQATPVPLGYGSIGGKVTEDGTGTPLAGVYARVRDTSNNYMGKVLTDANGDFQVDNLPPGTYKVWYQDPDGSHIAEYNGGGSTFSGAPAITVTASAKTTANNALTPGGAMTGAVTEDGTGTPLQATIKVRNSATNTYVTSFNTAADGSFTRAIAPGNYKLLISSAGHTSEWAYDKVNWNQATPIVVPLGGSATVNTGLAP